MSKSLVDINHMDKSYYAPKGHCVTIESEVKRIEHKVKLTVSYSISLDDMGDNFQYNALNFFCIHLRKPVEEVRKELHVHLMGTKGHETALERVIK